MERLVDNHNKLLEKDVQKKIKKNATTELRKSAHLMEIT